MAGEVTRTQNVFEIGAKTYLGIMPLCLDLHNANCIKLRTSFIISSKLPLASYFNDSKDHLIKTVR